MAAIFEMAAIIGMTTSNLTELSDFDYLYVHLYVFEVAEAEFTTVKLLRSLHLSSLEVSGNIIYIGLFHEKGHFSIHSIYCYELKHI